MILMMGHLVILLLIRCSIEYRVVNIKSLRKKVITEENIEVIGHGLIGSRSIGEDVGA